VAALELFCLLLVSSGTSKRLVPYASVVASRDCDASRWSQLLSGGSGLRPPAFGHSSATPHRALLCEAINLCASARALSDSMESESALDLSLVAFS